MSYERIEKDLSDHRKIVRRLEHWLCHGPAVLRSGPEVGAVAGRINVDGYPDYAYPEIAGYYLTWLVFRKHVGEASAIHATLANLVVTWVRRWAMNGMPTRLHLRSPETGDWRNNARFLFDMAMLIRGLAQVSASGMVDANRVVETLSLLAKRVETLKDERGRLRCLALRAGSVPDRWSTRHGPFMVKALVAILHAERLGSKLDLSSAARATLPEIWPRHVEDIHPDSDHAALYFAEGVLLARECGVVVTTDGLHFESLLQRCIGQPDADGTVAYNPRHDVLAQWLRASLLLSAESPAIRMEMVQQTVATRLAAAVRSDGALSFAADGSDAGANVWCAMFAHQALWLVLRNRDGDVVKLPEGCLV